MEDIAVQKNVGDKLPEKEIPPDHCRDETKNEKHLVSSKKLLEEYHSTENQKVFHYRSKRSAERDSLVRIIAHANARKGNSRAQ